ncbi:hypothetical protein EIN_060530 [Entamoeba invadens IP1]|uniref:hypothetical protein n=1 Tax=Entamoeba invadens IP1 TaxID=370355 RepID=UPI0002C3FAA6|nr:hypothetical protein EIN_060530 [Entamoeba invadens IP1]ELP93518.1 hypothetical protein EIN_060530 [Entamoeba invadens IP1]|eukprot:XP_004260289.1 hypothetical protein EIN_060530 [Entamoeba invadens IP1]
MATSTKPKINLIKRKIVNYTFSLSFCLFCRTNMLQCLFVDNDDFQLYTTLQHSPYLEKTRFVLPEPIQTCSYDHTYFCYSPLDIPTKVFVFSEKTNFSVDCSDVVISINIYKGNLVVITSTQFIIITLENQKRKTQKHSKIFDYRLLNSFIVILSEKEDNWILEVFEVVNGIHYLQTYSSPVTSSTKPSFELVSISQRDWIFLYQSSARIANLIPFNSHIPSLPKNILLFQIPICSDAYVAVSGDLLFVMTSSGTSAIFDVLVNSVTPLKLFDFDYLRLSSFNLFLIKIILYLFYIYSIAVKCIRVNQNQFVDLHKNELTILTPDFVSLSELLQYKDRYYFLQKHHVSPSVLNETLTKIFKDYEKGIVSFQEFSQIIGVVDPSVIEPILIQWNPKPSIYIYVMYEYINVHVKNVKPSLYCKLIDVLLQDYKGMQLLDLLQCNIFPDDELIATFLLTKKSQCHFFAQFAIDMLRRLKVNNDNLFKIIWMEEGVTEALNFAIENNVDLSKKENSVIVQDYGDENLCYQLNQYLSECNFN